LYSSSGLT